MAEAEAAHDEILEVISLAGQSVVLAYQGDTAAARAAAEAAIEAAAELGGIARGPGLRGVGYARPWPPGMLRRRRTRARPAGSLSVVPEYAAVQRVWNAEAALADGDLVAARGWADEAVSSDDRLSPVGGAAGRAPAWRSRKGEPEPGRTRRPRRARVCRRR